MSSTKEQPMGSKRLSFESAEAYRFSCELATRRATKFYNFAYDGQVMLASIPALSLEEAKARAVKEWVAHWFWWCPQRAPAMEFEDMLTTRGLDPSKVDFVEIPKP